MVKKKEDKEAEQQWDQYSTEVTLYQRIELEFLANEPYQQLLEDTNKNWPVYHIQHFQEACKTFYNYYKYLENKKIDSPKKYPKKKNRKEFFQKAKAAEKAEKELTDLYNQLYSDPAKKKIIQIPLIVDWSKWTLPYDELNIKTKLNPIPRSTWYKDLQKSDPKPETSYRRQPEEVRTPIQKSDPKPEASYRRQPEEVRTPIQKTDQKSEKDPEKPIIMATNRVDELVKESETIAERAILDEMAVSSGEFDGLIKEERRTVFQSRSNALKNVRRKWNTLRHNLLQSLRPTSGGINMTEVEMTAQQLADTHYILLRTRQWVEAPLDKEQLDEQGRYLEEILENHMEVLRQLKRSLPNLEFPEPKNMTPLPIKYSRVLFPDTVEEEEEEEEEEDDDHFNTDYMMNLGKNPKKGPHPEATLGEGNATTQGAMGPSAMQDPLASFSTRMDRMEQNMASAMDAITAMARMSMHSTGGGHGAPSSGHGSSAGTSSHTKQKPFPTYTNQTSGGAVGGQAPGGGGAGDPNRPAPSGQQSAQVSGSDLATLMMTMQENQRELVQCLADGQVNSSKHFHQAMLSKPLDTYKEVGHFDGTKKNWPGWKALWDAKVRELKGLGHPDNMLFMILKSCLKGEALEKINGLPPMHQSYDKAYQRLTEWYDSLRDLGSVVLKSMLEIAKNRLGDGDASAHTKLYDKFLSTWEMLNNSCQNKEVALQLIFISIMEAAMSKEAFNNWEGLRQQKRNPTNPFGTDATMDDLLRSLRDSIESMDATARHQNLQSPGQKKSGGQEGSGERTGRALSAQRSQKADMPKGPCLFCDKDSSNHGGWWTQCPIAKQLSKEEKISIIMKSTRCYNCLGTGHSSRYCTHKPCGVDGCQRKHTRILHGHDLWEARKRFVDTKSDTSGSARLTCTSTKQKPIAGTTICRSVVCYVVGPDNRKTKVRAIYDTGSELNLIRKSVADAIGLSGTKTTVKMEVVGSNQEFKNQYSADLQLRHIDGSYQTPPIKFTTVPFITKSPLRIPTDPKKYSHLKDLNFTEELPLTNDTDGTIDLLIGEPVVTHLFVGGAITGQSWDEPAAIKTKLGFCLAGSDGKVPPVHQLSARFSVLRVQQQHDVPLENFWKLEHMGIDKSLQDLTLGEAKAVTIMERQSYHTPLSDGKGFWTTGLPWDPGRPVLTDRNLKKSVGMARALGNRLAKNPEKKKMYEEAVQSFFDNDFAEAVPATEKFKTDARYCESLVVFEEGRNTKCRFVINPSGPDANGISLNDCLLQGPLLLPNMVSLLLRFRSHPVALGSDCSKMYLRIRIHPHDRDHLRFVILRGEDIVHARFKSLAFGLKPAPFMAMWCCQESARMQKEKYPMGAKALLQDLYVDDTVTGCASVQEARTTANQMKMIMEHGGFASHKWVSSHPDALKDIPPDVRSSEEIVGVLGMKWDVNRDVLLLMPSLDISKMEKVTKRMLLSTTARIFDVTGLLSPVWTLPKVWIQELWTLKKEWDEEVDGELGKEIRKWNNELKELANFKKSRCIVPPGFKPKRIAGFADSSTKAYATAIYLISENKEKALHSSLCFAKARVKPLSMEDDDKVTIVRLELMAALITARATRFVMDSLDLTDYHLFSDSQINLYRLLQNPNEYKVWTAVRLQEILSLSNADNWYYCPTALNPADLNSRGTTFNQLIRNDLWWKGPPFLVEPGPWQRVVVEAKIDTALDREEKPKKPPKIMSSHMVKTSQTSQDLLLRYESWRSTINVTCLVLRALSRFSRGRIPWLPAGKPTLTPLKNKPRTRAGSASIKEKIQKLQPISRTEFAAGERWWFRVAQEDAFAEEMSALKANLTVSKKSKIRDMVPRLKDGLLVGTPRTRPFSKLDLAADPPILPKHHAVTEKFVLHLHKLFKHTETEQTNANVKARAWIAGGRREIRRILHQCLCKPPTPLSQRMAPLPKERGEHTIWKDVSTDLFGPFYVRQTTQGESQSVKTWGCIFVCMVTRAIHLELLEDSTTESFLRAFRRYTSRRGLPVRIWSDNGKYFVKANKELQRLCRSIDWEKVTMETEQYGLEWRFSKPLAPGENAASERQIRNVKTQLKKILGNAFLGHIEFSTLLTEVEGIVNNRPLGLVYTTKDYHLITPAHFVMGRPLLLLPDDPENVDRASSISKLWLYRKRLLNNFWKRFHNQYLLDLAPTKVWQDNLENYLKEDQVVLVRDDNLTRNTWKTARIKHLHKGTDGKIRAATLVLPTGSEIHRSIHRLSLFERV